MLARVGGTLMLGFAVSFVVVVIVGVYTYRSVQNLIANNERVIRSQQVLDVLQDVQTSVLQTETDARGFLLTGEPAFEEAYRQHGHEIPTHIQRLRDVAVEDPENIARIDRLDRATARRLELLEDYVERREVLAATVVIGHVSEGKTRMQEVQAAIADLSAAQHRVLEERKAESNRNGWQLSLTLLLAVTSMIALLGLVFFLANRDIRYRRLNEDRLRAARDELELRVNERTAELSDLNTELERSNRELQDFAFVASHDLQEPLRKIQAFGDRLRTVQATKFDDQGRDYLNRMQNAAERMHVLINDLLTFSRVTTKAQPFTSTDLSRIAVDVVSDLETTIENADGVVRIGKLPTIDADEVQMRQLFQNLIANALKFRKQDSSPIVEVFCDEVAAISQSGDHEMIKIMFRDNGIGFDEKYLDRIFTPFQRLHGRDEYEGTGIGLAVCRKIVERHGGTLTAESREGHGTTFIVTLPVSQTKEK